MDQHSVQQSDPEKSRVTAEGSVQEKAEEEAQVSDKDTTEAEPDESVQEKAEAAPEAPASEKPENEAAKPQNGNQTVHTPSVSIKGVLKGEPRKIQVKDEEIDDADIVEKISGEGENSFDLSDEALVKVWNAFAESIEKENPRMTSTLQQTPPRFNEKGAIVIQLNSQAQRDNFINNIKPLLSQYLREHLADMDFVFEANLLQNESVAQKVYTDQDKLEYLMKKNEHLRMLKNKFNLDFD